METFCEKCGDPIEVFHEGRTQGLRCTKCDWSVATTYTLSIEMDCTVYEIEISEGDHRSEQQVKAISRITKENFLRARMLLSKDKAIIFQGVAKEIIPIRGGLISLGLAVKICPEFPW